MSWLLSSVLISSIFASITGFPIVSNENVATGNTPQLVILTPQTVLQGDETERFEQTYSLSANGRVSLANVNGSIVIEAWDRNEVKLEATKIANSKERLSQVQIKVDSKPDYLSIETEYGDWKNGDKNWNCTGYCRLEVQYKLMVPRNAVLNEIETVNGSVTISNMTNYTKASAVNGTVKATNLRGAASIETVNGTAEVDFDSLSSVNKIELSTVNGRVNLTLPSDVDATIKADTVNGSISNEFGLPVRKGKWVGRDLYGKVGDGVVKINLDSVNGGLNIKRKQDGKNLKPVVNLLPTKESDEDAEDDKDNEDGVAVVVGQGINKSVNKTVAKAVKESTKVARAESLKIAEQAPAIAAQAVREANRAMRDVNRDVMRANRDLIRANVNLNRINWDDAGTNRIEEQSETFQVKGTPKVTVDAKSCSVSVHGWDRDEVKYRITRRIHGTAEPGMSVSVSHTDTEVMINANAKVPKLPPPPGKLDSSKEDLETSRFMGFPSDSIRIEVFVPKKSNLRILTDREIRVDGVTGNIDLTGNEGAINVRDSGGKLKIAAADATIRVIGFNGEVISRTESGFNYFEGEFNKFSARAIDGKIVLTLPEDANANIEADTKINTEGFDLTEFKDDETHRRIGTGGVTYNLEVGEGQVLVRNSKLLKVTN